jgi:hypothetical protein
VLSIEELETAFRSARAELEAHSEQVAAKYRALIPDSPRWTGPGPDPEAERARTRAVSDPERARTARLRQAAMQASLLLARARMAARLEGGGRVDR